MCKEAQQIVHWMMVLCGAREASSYSNHVMKAESSSIAQELNQGNKSPALGIMICYIFVTGSCLIPVPPFDWMTQRAFM